MPSHPVSLSAGTLTQAIRNFAKTLEGWLRSATESTPAGMVRVKLSAVSAFAQTLRRYTSLNHLAQAARAVLQNSGQITQMLSDLNRVDFVNVQEQVMWRGRENCAGRDGFRGGGGVLVFVSVVAQKTWSVLSRLPGGM